MTPFNPADQISQHFTFREALFLPQWDRLATEEDGLDDQVVENLRFLLAKVDQVLDRIGWRARVHCCYRPEEYNALVKGARSSAHKADRPNVAAIDFDVIGLGCDEVRQQILDSGLLEELELRMEDNGVGSSWIHLDCAPVGASGHRYFKP